MADERIGVLMEAQNRISAPARQAAADITNVGAAAKQAASDAAALQAAVARTDAALRSKAQKGREAANAMSAIASASSGAGNGLAGMATAAGAATANLGAMTNSAKLATAATALGALVTVGLAIYAAWQKANQELEASQAVMERIGIMSEASIRARIGTIDQLQKDMMASTTGFDVDAFNRLTAERRELVRRDIENTRRDREQAASQAQSDAEQRARQEADAQRERMERAAKEAIDLDVKWANERSRAEIGTGKNQWVARKTLIDAELEAERAKVMENIALDDTQRDKILANIDKVGEARRQAVDEARKAASLMAAIVGGAVQAAVRAQEGFIDQLKRLALEPIITRLEGIAVREGIEAALEAAMFNFPGAARHAAVAAAAIGGARTLAGWAGGGGGGGRGGGVPSVGGGGGGAPSTFEPRGSGGAGGQTIIINTIDPTSRGVINTVRYQLNRSDVLNRPMIAGGGVQVYAAGAGA